MGENKLLINVEGQNVLSRTLSEIYRASFDDIALVGGHDWDLIRATTKAFPIQIAYNEKYHTGIYSSLLCGLQKFGSQFDFVTICLGDQPLLKAQDYERLLERMRRTRKKLVVPQFHGQRGNPTSLARDLFPAVLAQAEGEHDADRGAAFLFKEFAHEIDWVDMTSEATLRDLDTPNDLVSVRAEVATSLRQRFEKTLNANGEIHD